MENNVLTLSVCAWRRQLPTALSLFTLALASWAPLVQAQMTDSAHSVAVSLSSAPPVTVGDIDAVMQDKILLDALSARAKARAELNQLDAQLPLTPASIHTAASPANATANLSANLPMTAWRRPTSAGWVAKFVYPNGAFVVASIGEMLPGGLKVVRIDDNDVQILDAAGKKVSVAPARLAVQVKAGKTDNAQKTPTLSGASNFQPDFALPHAVPGQ